MRRFPGVALALAIDRSGSMGACHCNAPNGGGGMRQNGGVNKTDVSREAANRAVEALSPQDQVGVIAIDNKANTVVPLQFAVDKPKIKEGIGTISAGGNTNLFGGVQAAYDMLEKADAKIKHAILVTDGWSNKRDYSRLIAQMKNAKITLTVVAVDEGENLAFLRALEDVARQTGGRYYLVQDVDQIPKIYTREVQTVPSRRSSRSVRAAPHRRQQPGRRGHRVGVRPAATRATTWSTPSRPPKCRSCRIAATPYSPPGSTVWAKPCLHE
jgi:hypothetical protein